MTDNHRSVIGEITHGPYPASRRERNLKPGRGAKRIDRHNGCSVTSLIKEWAASAERRITHQLSGRALKQEKRACYRERHLGVDGEKVRVGLNLDAGTGAKMGRLARHPGYTITILVEELVESAERRVTARLPSRALKAYYDTE